MHVGTRCITNGILAALVAALSVGPGAVLTARAQAPQVTPAKDAAPAPQNTAATALLTRMFEAVNSKDLAKMTAFAAADCSADVPADERAGRLLRLAAQGAPFKLIRIASSTEAALTGLLQDGSGAQFAFTLNLTGSADAPRIASVRLGPPEDVDAKPPKDYTGWTDLHTLAAAIRADTESPAIGVALIRDGKSEVVTDGVRELGKPETVGPDEPWSVGSIGKPLCSSIIGKLIEMGKLHFETTLAEALPGFPMQPGYKSVTLEQIMHHRGGIPEDPGMRKPQVDAIIGNETDPVKMRDRYARDILSRDPIAKPGERFAYSNAGYALLAHIAELQLGKPYEQVVRDLVFQPLGLQHSYIAASTYPKDFPAGHMPGPNGLQPVNFRGPLEVMFAGAGGGIYMSVGDLATFGAAHLAGLQGKDGYLKAATVARLHQSEPEAGPESRGYACGWGIESRPGLEPWHGHNGSNGTFRAELAVFPKANMVAVAIVNRGGESDPSPSLQAVTAIAKRFARSD
jgi:CubicO group peptidase (beta-lactamase class C family)